MKEFTIVLMKQYRAAFYFFLIFFYSQSLLAKLIVISDIDDTIRRTETLNPARALVNLMTLRVPAYEGIRKMYWDLWATRPQVEFFYLSSSLKDIYDADDWLGRMQFPLGATIQRSREIFLKQSEEEYKINAILRFLKNESPETEIYFFGDNSFSDEVVYSEVVKRLSLKKAKIFIHDVTAATAFKTMGAKISLLPGIQYYVSEMDLINLFNYPESLGWLSFGTELTILKEYYRRSGLSSGLGPNLFLQLREQYCTKGVHAFAGCSARAEIEAAYFVNWYHKKYKGYKSK